MVAGQYEDGVLTGLGKVIMKDDTVRQGTFQHGYLHGPVRYSLSHFYCLTSLILLNTNRRGCVRILRRGPGLCNCYA